MQTEPNIYFFLFLFHLNYFLSSNPLLNNRDLNIDQNHHDYDFCHNQAALEVTGSMCDI